MNAYSSPTYHTLRQALIGRTPVRCMYHGHMRECCPHTLGSSDGVPRVLMFQYGGQSSSGLPPGGQWRCMDVAAISSLTAVVGGWHTGHSHLRPQTCVKNVDVKVNS